MQLALREARADAGEEGEVGAEAEGDELPPAAVEHQATRDRSDEQQRGEGGEGAAPPGGVVEMGRGRCACEALS